MKSLGDLEKFFDGLVKRASAQVAQAPARKSLLEVRAAILHDVKSRIEPAGRGKLIFPYTTINATVFSDNAAQVEGFFAEMPLAADCRELLEQAGCAPRLLRVEVQAAPAQGDEQFRVAYGREAAMPAAVAALPAERPTVTITTIAGATAQSEYVFDQERINLGRSGEVLSRTGGVVRVNDVVFADTEKAIGREHAYLRYDAATGRYRLHDDRSGERGTRLFRSGRSILVTRTGTEVKSGDEIHLGVARLRVTFG